jgi:mevalonate pyrophosphate decarboxylase
MVLHMGTRYVDTVRQVAMERAWRVADATAEVVPSAFGVHAAAVGAAAIALDAALYATER